MTELKEKLQRLREKIALDGSSTGPLLIVYPPEHEVDFAAGYEEVIKEQEAAQREVSVVPLRLLLFEVLEKRNLLQRTFEVDAKGSKDLHPNLANIVHKEVVARILQAACEDPDAVVFLTGTGALFPWISYSSVIEEVEAVVANTIVTPFPGTENGPELHFMGAKDGYNYRATRI